MSFSSTIISILIFLCSSITYLSHINTLSNIEYLTNKKALNKYVQLMGAQEYIESRLPLARQKLRLDAWHGHNEIVLKNKQELKNVSIDFNLYENGYFSIILYGQTRTKILRIGHNNSYPSLLADLTRYKFNNIKLISPTLKKTKNNIKIKYHNNSYKILINGDTLKETISYKLINIGLKGSDTKVEVTKLAINNKAYSFSIFRNYKKAIVPSLLVSILLVLLAFTMTKLKIIKIDLSLLLFYILYAQVTYASYDYFYLASRYPSVSKSEKEDEKEIIKKELREISKKIRKEAKLNPILFIGSSQTYGEGASVRENTWTSLYCSKMHSPCINASIRSATTQDFAKNIAIFGEHKYKEVMISLAHNDPNTEVHYHNLNTLVKGLKELTKKIILIVEPSKRDFYYLDHNQKNVLRICQEQNIKCINPSLHLVDNNDTGIIWWDRIHLTDYGHQLMFEYIQKNIK